MRILLALILLAAAGCSARTPSTEQSSPYYDPEVFNATPFDPYHVISEANGKLFFTAMAKVTFKNYPDGRTKFDQIQEPISQQTSPDAHCSARPYTINDVVPFRIKAELYLREGKSSTWSKLSVGKESFKLAGTKQCPALSTESKLVLVPYVADGTKLVLSGARAKKGWTIPKGFMPFVVVRYLDGRMIPVPMRLDTLILEPGADRLIGTYRSTFPIEPKVRKIDYYAILPDEMDKPSENETPEESLQRARITRTYLQSCAIPSLPVEACSDPSTIFPREIFGMRYSR